MFSQPKAKPPLNGAFVPTPLNEAHHHLPGSAAAADATRFVERLRMVYVRELIDVDLCFLLVPAATPGADANVR